MKVANALLIAGLIIYSCGEPQKNSRASSEQGRVAEMYVLTAYEQEVNGLNSGIIDDSVLLGVRFGMTEADYAKAISEIARPSEEDNIYFGGFNTSAYILEDVQFEAFFDESKLYRLIYSINPDWSKKKLDDSITLKQEIASMIWVGEKKYKDGTIGSKYYWINGNKRVDLFDTLGRYVVVISDLRVEKSINERIAKAQQKEDDRIFEILKKKANRNWPDDYVTQEYWLNQQKEDYQYMKSIPDDAIKRKAQRDFRLDFTTQRYWYNEQIEAKRRLNSQ